MKRALLFSPIPLKGRDGHMVMNHMNILQPWEVDYLNMNSTDGIKEVIKEKTSIRINKCITEFTSLYVENHKKWKSWDEVYNLLDVSSFECYDILCTISGILVPVSGLIRDGSRVNKFPMDNGQLNWESSGKRIINALAILKAHNEFKIPLHEIMFDPNDFNLGLCHADFLPKHSYHVYFGYDIPRYGLKRIDSLQHGDLDKTQGNLSALLGNDKKFDMVFGYTALKNSNRSPLREWSETIKQNFKKTRIFVDDRFTGENTFVPFEEYINLISAAKYTFIIPSYNSTCFSVYRFIESLANNCLPLIHPDCNIEEVNESFNTNLNILVRVSPFSEEMREKMLEEFKRIFLVKTHGFIGVKD